MFSAEREEHMIKRWENLTRDELAALDKDRTIAMLMDNCGLKKSCYVGDIKNDALCSKRAGIPFIWASYGFGGVPEELFYRKINDIRELKDIFIG